MLKCNGGNVRMTNKEAIGVLCANVIFACDRANFAERTKKMVEDALDIAISALENVPDTNVANMEQKYNQDIKADSGKPRLTLVPRQILFDVAAIREYGVKKYGERESWRSVEVERYRDAAFRHFMAYLDDPSGADEESGLPHLWHLATNIAFLCELEGGSGREDAEKL